MTINDLFERVQSQGMELIIRSDYEKNNIYLHLYYTNVEGRKIQTVYEVYTKNIGKELNNIERLVR